MERYLGKYSSYTYALLRIVAGLVFAQHGAVKLFGVLGGFGEPGKTAPLMSLMGLAGVIEFFGGLLIAVGLFAAIVAVVASGEMATAYFTAHAPNGFFPILNKGELAMVLCFVFLHVASRGAGVWSVDALRAKTPKSAS